MNNPNRDPSIHIRESKLIEILSELGIKDEDLVKQLLYKAKKCSSYSRSITVSNDKLQKSAKRVLIAEVADVMLMAKMIHMVRKQLKHRGIQIIRENSRDWGMVREITSAAVNFAVDFNLPKNEAFKQYIYLGLKKMNKFSLNKFLSMHACICETYEANLLIAKDKSKNLTDQAYATYNEIVTRNTGTAIFNYREMPDKFVFFIKAKEVAEEYGVTPRTYIEAQFYGLGWKNGIPDPVQLIGDKAIERLQKYVFEKGIKSTINTNINLEIVNAFKNLKNGNHRS